MSAVQTAFMNNQMAYMIQEIDSEFSKDVDEEENMFGPEMYNDDTSEDDMSVTTMRSQSLSADLDRLTIEESVSSSSRSLFIHGSSSTVRADKSPKHITISGDHTEVDNSLYETDFDSHKEENNLIINSFGDGTPGDVSMWQTVGMFI